MYVVVVYDAGPGEREDLRSVLMPQLHWIQNSVFAGELTQVAAKDLREALKAKVESAKVTFWLFDRKPTTYRLGVQDDRESMFV